MIPIPKHIALEQLRLEMLLKEKWFLELSILKGKMIVKKITAPIT